MYTCKECRTTITSDNKIENIYNCPNCGHPHTENDLVRVYEQFHIYHATNEHRFSEVEVQPRVYVGFVEAVSIEEAYQRSQNGGIYNSTHVSEALPWNPTNPCRSTSVGDIIQSDKDFYMVCGIGFKKLEVDNNFPSYIPELKPVYRYFYWNSIVIKLDESIHYKEVVGVMRATANKNRIQPTNMMIEDIKECTEKEYDDYMESQLNSFESSDH